MADIVEKNGQEFGKMRRIFFPIYMYELKKALPMGLMFFCILFNYTCLRNIKDSLIVTGPGSDAEVIPFLKGYCVAPCAILFMLLYTKASNTFTNEQLFYVTLTPFILFFGCFGFLIYPHLNVLHFSAETVAAWRANAPAFLKWPLAIIGNWSYSLFYILAEIWGSALLSLAFWQFANQITKTSEAKRMYAFFALMAQFSVLLEGKVGEWCSDIKNKVPEGVDPWGLSLKYMMGIVVLLGIVAMLIYRWIYKRVLIDKRFYDKPELPGNTGKGKKKMPLLQSFKVIFTSPYLGLIVALVVCYGISVNLVEGLWKKQLGMQYPNPNDYNTFMNQFTFYGGIASMVMLIIGGNIIRVCRWFTAAISTPLMLLLLGSLFFIFVLFKETLLPLLASLSTTPLFCAVILGACVVAISKAVKYALFDLTKEMAYIPLDEEMKVKGKAVADVVGGRFGKAGGAWIQSLLLLIPGATYFTIAPYTFTIFIVICTLWILSVKALSHRVEAATEKSAKD
ncbi:MAG: NTP/NDP exchange transporter [Puniceicoccales bacterium]|jgi:AAA family ATP:ADP antiporter|nr:NTP/NDP exchange transporter [Puniceicoccales bacterium]